MTIRKVEDAQQERLIELMAATIERQQALIDYISMVTDIVLPNPDDEEGD